MIHSTLQFVRSKLAMASLALVLLCASSPAQAVENEDLKALELVRWAMQAYVDLNIDESTSALGEALTLAPNLSSMTLARIYISFGVVWSGGLADSARGQESFMIALCLDPDVAVDPLLLTPEIETEFKLTKAQATPEACEATLAEVDHGGGSLVPKTSKTLVVQPEGLEMCGVHHPIAEQKRKHELPFFLMLNPVLSSRIASIKVMYAFDAPQNFKELILSPMGGGYGLKLDCTEGEIRILDPGNVYYYIEARDSSGGVVCGHASATVPMHVKMLPDAQPVVPIAGMEPKECSFCEPWDVACRKEMAGKIPGLGEDCQPIPGCSEGTFCGD